MNTRGMRTPPRHTASAEAAPTRPASARNPGEDPDSARPQGPAHGTRPPAGGNGLATAAVVLGIVGLTTSVVFIGGLLGVVGLALGLASLVTTRRTGAGRGKALTAVVTSSLAIVLAALAAVCLAWYADRTQECYRPDSFRQYKQCVHQQFGEG
ncbi:DUF4190 domain-containing protein [Streptomyces sp. HU2014]|uniref:DUF4190 domain-containing protein n=1 Tax=Streptomyces sp. HU2014 TaxID=2939414 RepID=UPI00200D9E3A|nr:DUF4190 domain-containing protein [Streptomyces sp. HU2014]UQI45434.1 DUF4190 domain-containing protein [Streptomyces sp. HU2014]